ncbi:MAG: hypothetical protein HY321_15195 [Armatimonadetes bacterium]|nr:hypothetical protein [Armatimonadota bacterium]
MRLRGAGVTYYVALVTGEADDWEARLAQVPCRNEPFLLPVDGRTSPAPESEVLPGDAELFAEFAFLESDEDIARFASTWGLLYGECWVTSEAFPAGRIIGERVSFWKREIRAMRAAVDLLPGTLSPDVARTVVERMDLGRRTMEAELYPGLTYSDHASALVVTLYPRTLAAALWGQFLVALERGSVVKKCAISECRNPVIFHSDPEAKSGKRGDAIYCSQACRFKAYRRRKAIKNAATKVRVAEGGVK